MTIGSATAHLERGPRPAHQIQYASLESRLAAAILDVLVLFIIASLLVTAGSLVVLISSDFEKVDPSGTAINIFWGTVGAILPAFLLYFFVGFAWKGQTAGAAVMQIMIIRSDGRPLGVLGAVARVIGLLAYVLLIGIGLAVSYTLRDSVAQAAIAIGVSVLLVTLGVLWAAFDSHRRTLHDRLAGTIVVHIE